MLKLVAFVIETALFIFALWISWFLWTFLHELGHAVGYMLSTGDRNWHIRVGFGKRLLKTKKLSVSLFVIDGCFIPDENRMDSRSKRICMLAGGPIISALLVAAIAFLRFGGIAFDSEVIALDTIEFFLNNALFVNSVILFLSILPIRYLWGEIKGLESDGLQIFNAIKKH